MNRIVFNIRRELPHVAAVAGLLSALLLFAARPVHAATPAQDQVTRDFQKTVMLGAGQSVHIEHKFGEVRVHGESGHDVKISATIRAQASSHEEAEAFAQKIQIEVQQTSEGVRIKTTSECRRTRRSLCGTVSATWTWDASTRTWTLTIAMARSRSGMPVRRG
jgi:hypothetical protein